MPKRATKTLLKLHSRLTVIAGKCASAKNVAPCIPAQKSNPSKSNLAKVRLVSVCSPRWALLNIRTIKRHIHARPYRNPAKVKGGILCNPVLIKTQDVDQRNTTRRPCRMATRREFILPPHQVQANSIGHLPSKRATEGIDHMGIIPTT
jgi:hypothetical protein